MINSVYVKTMGNLRKRINGRLLNNEKDFLKYTSWPTHITHKIFDQNYAALHEIEPVLTLNKPIYVGFTVLELSKWLMHDFHDNIIKKHFDGYLLFTNPDSLTYEIQPEDIYETFFKHKHLFDFSNYPKDSKIFYSTYWENDRRVWRKNNWWVCWSKVKNVFYKNIDGKESNTAKGVNIGTEFNEFKDTLFNQKVLPHQMRSIQSKKYKMGTYVINKTSLLCFVLNGGIHTLAYFHKELRK